MANDTAKEVKERVNEASPGNGRVIGDADENMGPAVLGREPLIAPDAREEAVETVKDTLGM